MARTVITIYEEPEAAFGAVRDLMDHGFQEENISIITDETSASHEDLERMPQMVKNVSVPGVGTVAGKGPLLHALGDTYNGQIVETFMEIGIPETPANSFAEGLRRGGTLVVLHSDDSAADQARDIMDQHHPYDVNARASQWRQFGWEKFDPQTEPYSSEKAAVSQMLTSEMPATQMPATQMPDTRAPESNMAEAQWQESQNANAPTPIPQTGQMETDTDISRQTSDNAVVTYSDFSAYEADFRNHFATTMVSSGYTYEQYQPAYRYGYNLVTNQRNQGREWKDIEPEAKRYWDERNPGTWDHIKGAVRYAWDEIRDSVR